MQHVAILVFFMNIYSDIVLAAYRACKYDLSIQLMGFNLLKTCSEVWFDYSILPLFTPWDQSASLRAEIYLPIFLRGLANCSEKIIKALLRLSLRPPVRTRDW